ncbi:MAG: NPCBM/NEW2 domain-containing protein, partial [Thermoguttaceae bacterium]
MCQAVKSDAKRGGEKAQKLTVDVSGMESLGLSATGYSWGQAVWGEATLIASDGTETRLVDLKPESVRVGWGKFSLNTGPDGKPLKVADRQFDHGIFAHADSLVTYRLDKKYKTFEAWVGINATAHTQGRVVFEIGDPAARLLAERNRQLLNSFTKENIAALRGSLERSLSERTGDPTETKKRLAQLDSWEETVDAIREGLGKGNADAASKAAEYADFVQSIYASKLDAPLLFVKRHPYMAGHIYDDYLTWRPGGGIYVIENPAAPVDQQVVRAVIDPNTKETLGEGVYRDPDISYDGKRVLFAFKDQVNGNTSIYEIGIDGTGLRRLTDPGCDCQAKHEPQGLVGKGQHDITPCYLPDDRIAFTSTRTGGLVMCFSSYIDTLHTMNSDGTDIKSISVNNQNEFDPSVLPDGRILYGRWEYVDK